MTASRLHNPTNTELLARIEELQVAMLQQQTAMQTRITALEVQKNRQSPFGERVRSSLVRPVHVPHRRRVMRLGVGLGLASLLLLAPWGSGTSHAAGTDNTSVGDSTLLNPTGSYNSAFGSHALTADADGNHNQASGSYALTFNTSGSFNSASGADALKFNSSGSYNTASGDSALLKNTTGTNNTASGYSALYANTTGNENTASGYSALVNNDTGNSNTASGQNTLLANTSGSRNTASGVGALFGNTTGSNNTVLGFFAGYTSANANANTTGSNNTFIGYNSGPGTPTQLTNATAIGANAVVSQSNSIVLGGIGANTQKVGVGTTTPHSALQIAKGFLQLRPITGPPAPEQCATADDAGRLVVRTDGAINLYVCNGSAWIGK